MTPADAMRCAGWAARMAAWAALRQWGAAEDAATARMGVRPVTGTWRRVRDGAGLSFDADGAWHLVAVREWVTAGPTVWAVGEGCVWALATAKEGR